MKSYDKLKNLYDEIDVLISNRVSSEDAEFIKWKTQVERFLKKNYSDGDEYKRFINTPFSLMVWTCDTSDDEWIEACAEGLNKTKAIFEVYLEEMQDLEETDVSKNFINSENRSENKVFVVHGHDGELKQEVARTLERQGIEPIILSEQANRGATIIEKFEKNADVKAAICLFTNDDLGKEKTKSEFKMRARQNVVFEAGFFIGKLGRANVVLLADNNIEMPSDLEGIVYTDNSNWTIDVLKELRAMGFEIDLNKVI